VKSAPVAAILSSGHGHGLPAAAACLDQEFGIRGGIRNLGFGEAGVTPTTDGLWLWRDRFGGFSLLATKKHAAAVKTVFPGMTAGERRGEVRESIHSVRLRYRYDPPPLRDYGG